MERLTSRLHPVLRGLPPVYWALLAGMFVNRLASFVATFLGLYLVRARGFSPEQAAPVVALFGAGVLVGAPVGGVLADAVGRRATMLLSFGTGAIAVGALGFVRSPAALAPLRFLAAATSELYRPAMNAAIADVVSPPDRARAWGLSYWACGRSPRPGRPAPAPTRPSREVIGFPFAALLVADLAPRELRGRYQGAFSMCWGIAFTLSPLVGGGLLARRGPTALWLACLAAGVAVALGHLAAAPGRRRRLAELAPPAGPPTG